MTDAQQATDVVSELVTSETEKQNLQYLAVHYHEALRLVQQSSVLVHNCAWAYYTQLFPTASVSEITEKVRAFEQRIAVIKEGRR